MNHDFILLAFTYLNRIYLFLCSDSDMINFVYTAIEKENKKRQKVFNKSFNKYLNKDHEKIKKSEAKQIGAEINTDGWLEELRRRMFRENHFRVINPWEGGDIWNRGI